MDSRGNPPRGYDPIVRQVGFFTPSTTKPSQGPAAMDPASGPTPSVPPIPFITPLERTGTPSAASQVLLPPKAPPEPVRHSAPILVPPSVARPSPIPEAEDEGRGGDSAPPETEPSIAAEASESSPSESKGYLSIRTESILGSPDMADKAAAAAAASAFAASSASTTPAPPRVLPAVKTRPVEKQQVAISPASSGSMTPTGQSHGNKGGGGGGGGRGGDKKATPMSSSASTLGGKATVLKAQLTRAERRALQEAQRAAKAESKAAAAGAAGGGGGGGGKGAPKAGRKEPTSSASASALTSAPTKGPSSVASLAPTERQRPKEAAAASGTAPPQQGGEGRQVVAAADASPLSGKGNRVELFRHLPHYVPKSQLAALEGKFLSQAVPGQPHPAIFQLGLEYLRGSIVGGNARTLALLAALRVLIGQYRTPPEKQLPRDLSARISLQLSFLVSSCRPLCPGMGNAVRALKQALARCGGGMTEGQAKESLLAEIDRFAQEKILLADAEIVRHAIQKIRPAGDVLLTFGCSHVVEQIFVAAHDLGRTFRVVVVDSRPKMEGRALLRRLLTAGIHCSYVSLNAVSYIMPEVTRVFLGASGVMANGFVRSRVGSAAVGMVAHSFRVPVMVCCETYKFHERVQLDSITTNEIGDPDDLVTVIGREDQTVLQDWSKFERLQLLNLKYDAMPPEYVTMIVSELGMVPPTSVPVILREYRKDTILL